MKTLINRLKFGVFVLVGTFTTYREYAILALAIFFFASQPTKEVVTISKETHFGIVPHLPAAKAASDISNKKIAEMKPKPVASPAVVSKKENPAPKKAYTPTRSNRKMRSDYGYQIKDLSGSDLKAHMLRLGYRNLDGFSKHELRRLYLAYEYNDLYVDVWEKTGFPVSMIFAYFVYESTREGIETDLWRIHWNPGGLKHKYPGDKWVHWYDDCGGKPCKFQSHDSYEDAVAAWARTLNASRYAKCKSYADAKSIVTCVQRSYSTSPRTSSRVNLMREYWRYKKHFPIKQS